jgi:hypothetical protein
VSNDISTVFIAQANWSAKCFRGLLKRGASKSPQLPGQNQLEDISMTTLTLSDLAAEISDVLDIDVTRAFVIADDLAEGDYIDFLEL